MARGSTGSDDDLIISKTVIDLKPNLKDIDLALSNDDEMDHRHLYNDDDNPNLNQIKMKVVVGPLGTKIRVEMD